MGAAGADDDAEPAAATGSGDRLGPIVFAALIAACFVAFFLTQRLKHTPTAVARFELTPYFSPTPEGHVKEESISFKLAHAERATVTVIDSDGDVVATLLRRHPVPRYKEFSLRWNGRRGVAHGARIVRTSTGRAVLEPQTRGPLAAGGEYRVRLQLSRQREPVLLPRSFTLVAK
jgi:hypothetical protein